MINMHPETHVQIPAVHSPILNEAGSASSTILMAFPTDGITLLPGLGPFVMEVRASSHAKAH